MECVLEGGGCGMSYSNLMEKPEGQRDQMRDLGWILKKRDGRK